MSKRTVIEAAVFLKPLERKIVDVPLPEFGKDVVVPVWSMTARERSEFDEQFRDPQTGALLESAGTFRERLVVQHCRNDDGTPIFTIADVAALGEQQAAVVERIVDTACKISAFSATDVERLEGN